MAEKEKCGIELKLLKTILYGVEKALWDALGKGSLAFTPFIGEKIYEEVGQQFGKRIENSSLQELLEEIGRFYTEKTGFSKSFRTEITDSRYTLYVEGCQLMDVEKKLIEDGVTPFICPLMNSVAYLVRKKLGVKSRITEINVDPERAVCKLSFEVIK